MKLIVIAIWALAFGAIAHAGPKEDIEKESAALVATNAQLLADFNIKMKFMREQVLDPRAAQFNAETAEYTTRCNRTFNRETEIAQYNQCSVDKARLDTEQASTQKWMDEIVQKWNADNLTPVNAKIAKNNARLAELNAAYLALPKSK